MKDKAFLDTNVLVYLYSSNEVDKKNAIDEIRSSCKIVLVDMEVMYKALDIHDKYGFSYFDSLMLSSSIMSACKFILSEDMNNGQIIDSKLKIVNIFIRD